MTEAELRRAYPGAADAVLLHEAYCPWMLSKIKPEFTPAYVRDALVKSATLAAVLPGPITLAVVEQMRHPDFLRYVAAKMGAL